MPNIHVTYLCALYLILYKIRREGLIAIEEDTEVPEQSRIFQTFPELQSQPAHFAFLRDTMRLMVSGTLDPELVALFADTAEKSYLRANNSDIALLDVIRVTLLASLRGCAPQIAVEFGRQAIAFETRPTFDELEQLLRSIKYAQQEEAEAVEPPLEQRVAAWFARLNQRGTV